MVVVPSLLVLNAEVYCGHGLFSPVECKFFWHILGRKKKKQEKEIIGKHQLNCILMFLAIVLHKIQTKKRANQSKTACNKIGCILKGKKVSVARLFLEVRTSFPSTPQPQFSDVVFTSPDFVSLFLINQWSKCDCSLVWLNPLSIQQWRKRIESFFPRSYKNRLSILAVFLIPVFGSTQFQPNSYKRCFFSSLVD